MRYSKEILWDIVPKSIPMIKKHCSKCGGDSLFLNTKKFRVNANKSCLDVWLIYQCKECKTSWNMTILERTHPCDIDKDIYNKFLCNDMDLAKEYGFSKFTLSKNRVKLYDNNIQYEILGEAIDITNSINTCINLSCKYPLDIRLDKIISEKLNLSRNRVKQLINEGIIKTEDGTDLTKKKLKDSIKIIVS